MMDDLLKALLSGAGSQGGGGQAEENPLADVLGSLLGGAQGPPSGGVTPEAGGAADLLQGLLGGPQGGAQEEAGAGDLLGLVLGGGGAQMGAGSALAPLANAIAEKIGLPPEIAQVVVAFVLSKLLSGGEGAPKPAPARPSQRRRKGKPPRPEGLNLGSLLNQARSGQELDSSHVRATGIHEELAQQTGLDPDTAARSLEEVLKLLGGPQGLLGGPQGLLGGPQGLLGGPQGQGSRSWG